MPVVNGTHTDYKKHVVQGSAEDGRRYLVTVAATPMAMWEVKDAIKHGKPFADEYEIAAEVARRAQDLAFRALNGGGR